LIHSLPALKQTLGLAWRKAMTNGYHAVFAPALELLNVLPAHYRIEELLQQIVACADEWADRNRKSWRWRIDIFFPVRTR